ncbi:MAG: LysM peptidoglycan-binding domain-containing protein [Desulfotignum sp.]
MIRDEKPAPKIPISPTTTNRKKKPDTGTGPWASRSALFKKNETTLIIAGALVLTLVLFLIFFRSSAPKTPPAVVGLEDARLQEMADRLASVEQSVASLNRTLASVAENRSDSTAGADLSQVRTQMASLESGVQARIEALTGQVARLEKSVAEAKTPVLTAKPEIQEKKTAVQPAQGAAEKPADSGFHTVKKGETLWRISQEYGTTVARLRQLNNLATDADIYPGTKIRVR